MGSHVTHWLDWFLYWLWARLVKFSTGWILNVEQVNQLCNIPNMIIYIQQKFRRKRVLHAAEHQFSSEQVRVVSPAGDNHSCLDFSLPDLFFLVFPQRFNHLLTYSLNNIHRSSFPLCLSCFHYSRQIFNHLTWSIVSQPPGGRISKLCPHFI